jgi:5'-nucleotidase
MRILVSNDDGIEAPGLRALAAALREVGEVVVVAPDRERSAVSHAITMYDPLRAVRADFDGLRAWAVSGMPADCVLLGCRELLDAEPDVIVAGINRGDNLGEDIWYSGTVSAAMEGAILGVPSVALSVATAAPGGSYDYRAAAAFARLVVPLAAKNLPADVMLNVNVPNSPAEAIAGVVLARQGRRRYQTTFDKRQDPRGGTYYWLGAERPLDERAEGTDVTAVRDGFVAVTPVAVDLTAHGLFEAVAEWLPTAHA